MKLRITLLIAIVFSALILHAAGTTAKPVVSILGDSYSTFTGYIPEGNAAWYSTTIENNRTDVNDVRQTWWWQLISEGGYILGSNESYSGTTIAYTGYNFKDFSDKAFLTRMPRIAPSDILLIFGATNDSWIGTPIGEYRYDNLTLGHMYEFRPALGVLLKEAVNRFPGTRIVFIINTELKPDITESIEEICRHYGVEYVKLHDIDKITGHPSVKGMAQIKNQVLDYLRK